ncbi:unnamed protein product [Vicia faba]|uniref:Uncharacterized protein n=1 Tax=Vicia faba TaxID=3906 RepID=A0AAV0ZXQ9_VICFA|nr:unnamed protein product [Vicia faba]
MSVSLYFTQLKSLWDELHSIAPINPCICGNAKSIIDQQNQDRAMEFFRASMTDSRPSAAKFSSWIAFLQFSIHGFPNKPPKKSERFSSTSATQLSSAQYQKLLSLLAKEDTMGSSVNLAGPSNEEDDWSG